jgi:general stress protein 26
MVNTADAPLDDLKARILGILARHRTMVVATRRPDGWPQATIVGYANDDLELYFVIAATSQKLANIAHDRRVSIAIGGDPPAGEPIVGLSMAATAAVVSDPAEVERLNELVARRYPEHAVFSPGGGSVRVLKALPEIISVVDSSVEGGRPRLVQVLHEAVLRPLPSQP